MCWLALWRGQRNLLHRLLCLTAPVARQCAFNAWVRLKGLETLDLRMRVHSENAQRLSEWWAEQSSLEAAYCCGLPDHPAYALAMRQPQGFGGVLAFEVAGGREADWQFIYGTELISLTANVADAKTISVHPASTTHGAGQPGNVKQRAYLRG